MAKRHFLTLAATLMMIGMAAAQDPRKAAPEPEKETTCPAPAQRTGDPKEAMNVEKSAILPSAGGHDNSAAPTVQREGKAVEVQPDCPKDPADPSKTGKPAG